MLNTSRPMEKCCANDSLSSRDPEHSRLGVAVEGRGQP
jgi:hypothetical protein